MPFLYENSINGNVISQLVTNYPNIDFDIDITVDNSAKTFTVPATEIWQIVAIYVSLATTATAGNRILSVDISNPTPTVILRLPMNGTQAASLSNYIVWLSGLPAAAISNNLIRADMPAFLFVPCGYTIKIWDRSAIDATHDDMIVAIHHLNFPVKVT